MHSRRVFFRFCQKSNVLNKIVSSRISYSYLAEYQFCSSALVSLIDLEVDGGSEKSFSEIELAQVRL